MAVKINDTRVVEPVFDGWEETIIWSCLQNIMGSIYADHPENPVSAMAMLGAFCFLAGEPDPDLVRCKPATCQADFMIMVPQHEGWNKTIEAVYGEKAKPVTRYAFKKDGQGFDRNRLAMLAAVPDPSYTLHLINEEIYHLCRSEDWSRDLVSQFDSWESYRQNGIGVAVMRAGVVVSGASTYSRYQGGIEIEIDTRPEFRRQGLAAACGARLILECLNRELYPSWDAQNLWSVALAKKLGYQYDHEYRAYEIWGY